MAEVPTAEELEALFREGKMERIGMGSRRACYRIPGTELCVKCYRSDEEIEEGAYKEAKLLSPSVVREIKRSRFDEKRNTCCQEYRYWMKLRKSLPSELFAVFPQAMECFFVPSRGWCIVEELVLNFDGSFPLHFAEAYKAAGQDERMELRSVFGTTIGGLVFNFVRLYDPHNIMVQRLTNGDFQLRIVDFEPASRCFIPIESIFPSLIRKKTLRRVNRYLQQQLAIELGRMEVSRKM